MLQGSSGMFLEHLIALGSSGSTSGLSKSSLSCPSDLSQIKPEHLYSDADLQAVKDRQKKDNHNMSKSNLLLVENYIYSTILIT